MDRTTNDGTAKARRGLRLLVYDRTCIRTGAHLTPAWFIGANVYRAMQRIDAHLGATSWDEALSWLAEFKARDNEPIDEIQYWGHGRWGRVLIDEDRFDRTVLEEHHPLHSKLAAVRERLSPNAFVWLRTCEAFGATAGHDFAQQLADSLGVRVAGHTFIIGVLQSGLRALAPGCRPRWSASEGLAEGTPDNPERAHTSNIDKPRTIHCLTNRVPRAFFEEDSEP